MYLSIYLSDEDAKARNRSNLLKPNLTLLKKQSRSYLVLHDCFTNKLVASDY